MIRIAQHDLEEEAVDLRLRQRVRSFHFDRVERCQDKEGALEPVRRAGNRHLQLRHGFEQRRLRFRGGAVDLVGEHDVGKQRPRNEGELAPSVLFHDHSSSGHVGGHQVDRELDPAERQVQGLGKRAHDQRLAGARHAFDQHVAAGEEGNENLVEHLAVPDDDAAELLAQTVEDVLKVADHLLRRLGNHWACCQRPFAAPLPAGSLAATPIGTEFRDDASVPSSVRDEYTRRTRSSYSGGISALRNASSRHCCALSSGGAAAAPAPPDTLALRLSVGRSDRVCSSVACRNEVIVNLKVLLPACAASASTGPAASKFPGRDPVPALGPPPSLRASVALALSSRWSALTACCGCCRAGASPSPPWRPFAAAFSRRPRSASPGAAARSSEAPDVCLADWASDCFSSWFPAGSLPSSCPCPACSARKADVSAACRRSGSSPSILSAADAGGGPEDAAVSIPGTATAPGCGSAGAPAVSSAASPPPMRVAAERAS